MTGSAFHSLRETVRTTCQQPCSTRNPLFISNSFWPTQSPPGLGGRRVVTKPLNGTEAGSGRSASQWRGIRHSPPPATKIPEEPVSFSPIGCWPPWRPHRALAPMNKDAERHRKVGMSNSNRKSGPRPDVAEQFGRPDFAQSGWTITVDLGQYLDPGKYRLDARGSGRHGKTGLLKPRYFAVVATGKSKQ